MEFALAQTTSVELDKQASFITNFSNHLENYFLKKDYGKDLKSIIIGINCVSPNFEQFFKIQKPKYIGNKKVSISKYTGQSYEIEKCLSYDLKLDFETFKNISEIEAKKYLSEEILKSIDIIGTMQKKIKDFDLLMFKKDLSSYFKEFYF